MGRLGTERDRRFLSRKTILHHFCRYGIGCEPAALGKRRGYDRAAFGYAGQKRCALVLRSGGLKGRNRHTQGRQVRYCGQTATDFLGKDRQFHRAHPCATLRFRYGEAKPAAIGQYGPGGRIEPVGAVEPVVRALQGGVIAQHPGQCFAYGILLLGKSEIHAGVPPCSCEDRVGVGRR